VKTDVKITSERENKLLERREVEFEVSYEQNAPPRKDVAAKLAAKMNAKEDLVVLKRMKTQYGRRLLLGQAKVYRNPEHLKAVEYDYLFQRGKPRAADGEQAKAEAPGEKAAPGTKG